MIDHVAQDVNKLIGNIESTGLISDESSFVKQGIISVGTARQWWGRLGKVDNGQVAVFGSLVTERFVSPFDVRFYLPKEWYSERMPFIGLSLQLLHLCQICPIFIFLGIREHYCHNYQCHVLVPGTPFSKLVIRLRYTDTHYWRTPEKMVPYTSKTFTKGLQAKYKGCKAWLNEYSAIAKQAKSNINSQTNIKIIPT